jgi:uncharacterized repeat protein (TIGR04138 family)
VPKAPQDLIQAIRTLIREKDPRYPFEAYQFLYEALDHTIQKIGERRHVSGQELVEGIRGLATLRFGPLAKMVFDRWNIHQTEDFGEIVFNLVEAGLMSKTDTDTREDFQNGFNFDEAFRFDA